jgi:type III pantothenate kinase
MNIAVDLGNTCAKVGIFNQRTLLKSYVMENPAVEVKKLVFESPEVKHSIVCSVVSHTKDITNVLQNRTICLDFDMNTRLPFSVTYSTPETLGKDRIAAVAGAIALFPGKPLLVIDAGTCIKYNFVNGRNEFVGGAISPGLDMRFRALNQFTDRLPHLSYEKEFTDVIGTNTRGSILSGVQRGLIFEAEGYIKRFKEKNKEGIVVATGGNLSFLEDGLKNSIFAAPDLILNGLNEILLHHTAAA